MQLENVNVYMFHYKNYLYSYVIKYFCKYKYAKKVENF